MNSKTYKLPNGKTAVFEYDVCEIGKVTLECMDELMAMIADRPQGEWIDAEWLKELYRPYESYNGKELAVPIGAILANIADAPSIDIVRCKECRHCKKKRGTFRNEPIIFYRCEEHNRDVESDDYCSWGERSEE